FPICYLPFPTRRSSDLERSLPGSMTNSLPGSFDVALESERVIDGLTEQTPDPMPRAHLRQNRPASGSVAAGAESRGVKFSMRRVDRKSTRLNSSHGSSS